MHTYACWQYCYLNALLLNDVLNNPLPCQSPAFLFDGRLVIATASSKKLDFIDCELQRVAKHKELFCKLMRRLPCTMATSVVEVDQKRTKKKRDAKESKANPFAALQDAEDV